MSNKVKDIFSDDMYDIDGTLRFVDKDAYKNFLKAVDIACSEGRIVHVEGVKSISTAVRYQNTKYSIAEHDNILDFYVGPIDELVTISLDVGDSKKTIKFMRSITENKITLISMHDAIVYFELTFFAAENKNTLKYNVRFDKANNLTEVAESFLIASSFISSLYDDKSEIIEEKDKIALENTKGYFRYYEPFLRRLIQIENKLGIKISPSLLSELSQDNILDIDEMYLLLCEEQVIRLNAKLTSTDKTVIDISKNHTPNIGDKLALTFVGTIRYAFLNQSILLHTANLVMNALIKDIENNSDGTVKILYGDTDSKPMYISFSAFLTEEEAQNEANEILAHEDKYINALIRTELIKRFYS